MHPSGKVIFLGILIGSLTIFFLATHLIEPGENVLAATGIQNQTNHQDTTENDDLHQCNLPSTYPESVLKWCQIIQSKANHYGLDPKMIAAVMLQESGGDPNAYSKSGAVGLLQVMPRDGIAENFNCINGPCFAGRPSMDELFQPEFNIDYGSRMLVNLHEKYGNWREALKYYGPIDVGYHYADLVLSIYERYQ